MRKVIGINFDWMFKTYEESDLKKISISKSKVVHIPHNAVDIPFNNFEETETSGVFSYFKKLEVDESFKDKVIRLRFEGVAHFAKVYINKEFVGAHIGGYTPFELIITDKISFEKDNELLVIVDTSENQMIPPFGGVVDYLGYGGIYREVSLIVTDISYVKDVFVENRGSNDLIVNLETSRMHGTVEIEIKDPNLQSVLKYKHEVKDHISRIKLSIEKPMLWGIDHPNLYTLYLHYKNNKDSDHLSTRFGIRSAIFKTDGFYLNGEKIKLIGLNRHQSYPYVGYAMPKSAQIEDADILKYQLGLNIVRTSHYPQSKDFIERCDEIGLLVFEEIPGWQHIGTDSWKEISYQHVKEMILRDRNHPSIILWGVRINESPDQHDFYKRTNDIARAYDPTRQTGGVRNMANSEFLEDVYTYNDFSHIGHNSGLEKRKKITKEVPYLVTEYMGHMFPTKIHDDESHRIEHMKRHLNVIHSILEPNNGISGGIGWCMNDYNTHADFGSGDKVCYHGVLDMYRIPKLASLSYRAEGSQDIVLEVTSTMNIGEYPGGNLPEIIVMTNLDYVKVYKNKEYIHTFYPNHKKYPHLKHPPVIVDDLIGETLMKNEKMKYRDAERTKRVLRAVTKYGNNLPLRYKLSMLYILKKYKMTYDMGVQLFYKYMSGWGSKETVYTFEGYLEDKLMKTVSKENNHKFDFELETNLAELKHEYTYDVKRYVIKKVNQHQEIVPYAMDCIDVRVNGSIELIGPSRLHLHGGAIAFWVKTVSSGVGYIEIQSEDQLIIEEVNVL
ncbi:MAG: glycoside hydrolase family 2 protein [Firmicutes bacterium]|nr:glycoside hydrolase family 2 protein [Bacillota bacterium]